MFKNRLFSITVILTSIILATSFLIYLVEYIYGNGDGVWMDINIKDFTYKSLLTLYTLCLIIYQFKLGPSLLSGLLFTLIASVTLIFILEKLSLFYVNFQEKPTTVSVPNEPFLRPDWTNSFVLNDTLGVSAKQNWLLKWAPLKDGILHDSIYISTDELGRRTTQLNASKDSLDQYAIFFGCSYTYGDGVSDHETLPSYFQSLSKRTQAYNYGYLAYSPLHMLARLQQTNIPDEIKQQKGVAFFTLINDHLDRVIPASRWIELTLGRFPYVDPSTMITEGTFEKKRHIYTDLILDFQHRGLKKVLKWGYPKEHNREHFEHLANIIAKSKEEFQLRFNNQEFYVIIFPGNPISDELKAMFKERNVEYLDYSSLISIEDKMLPFDNAHPSPEVYAAIAKQLKIDIPQY